MKLFLKLFSNLVFIESKHLNNVKVNQSFKLEKKIENTNKISTVEDNVNLAKLFQE